jgi:hypothetical protein
MFLRTSIFVLLPLTFFLGWHFVAVTLWLWYLVRYGGFEIVILGFIIDGYLYAFSGVPVFTLVSFCAWSVGVFLRKLLLVYTHTDEILS